MPGPWKIVAVGGLTIGALGAVLAAVSRHRQAARPPARRIALIGDSYAVGLGPELEKTFPNFKYEGHVGNTVSQWANHSAQCGACGDWLTAFRPNVVLVALGVNDGTTPNFANYQTIVRALHGAGAQVVWIEPPSGVQNVNAVRRIIASLGVQTIPATNTALSGDRVHPKNYSGWAREIAQAIQ